MLAMKRYLLCAPKLFLCYMNKQVYSVTKQFTGGLLKGITLNDITPVKFTEGMKVKKSYGCSSPYKVTKVVALPAQII